MKFQFELAMVEDAKKFYKMYSIWFFALLGLTPDLYNLAISNGLIQADHAPAMLARIVNVIAFVGAASRLVQQKVATEQASGAPNPPIGVAVEGAIVSLAEAAATPAPAPVAPAPAPEPVAPPPPTPLTLAELLSATSTPADVSNAVREQVASEFKNANMGDATVQAQVLQRSIDLAQELAAKVAALVKPA